MLSAGSYGGNAGRAAVRPRLVVLSHFSSREVEVQSCLYESDNMYAIIPRVPGIPIGRRIPILSRRQNSASSAVDSTLLQSRGQVDRSKQVSWRAYIVLKPRTFAVRAYRLAYTRFQKSERSNSSRSNEDSLGVVFGHQHYVNIVCTDSSLMIMVCTLWCTVV